jgi:membrane protein
MARFARSILRLARRWRVGLRQALEVARAVGRDYAEKRISIIAAALAYYLFLALFPFLLVVIAAVGYIFGSSEHGLELLRQTLAVVLPEAGREVRGQLEIITAKRALVGGLGLVALAWSASNAFAILGRALRIVWEVKDDSMFLLARLRALGLLALAVIFLLLSVLASSAASVLAHLRPAGVSTTLDELVHVWRLASAALPLAIGFITFLALYRIVPAAQIELRHAAAGAAFAAVAWEIAKRGFAWYLERFASFDRVYGPVGAIVVLMLWIYISVVIALIGAELAWVYSLRERARIA